MTGNPTTSDIMCVINKQQGARYCQTGIEPTIVLLTKREIKLVKDHFAPYKTNPRYLHEINTIMGLQVVRCKHPPEQRVY